MSAADQARAAFEQDETVRTALDRADRGRVDELQHTLGDPETTRELYELTTRMYDRQGDRMRQLRAVWAAMDAEMGRE